jgi:hypothetical protein
MALSKIKASSVDLTDNYAFTGNVSGAGALTHIETKTISSGQTNVDWTSGISSDYDMYMWHVIDVDIATDSNFQIVVSTNGGSSFITGAGEYDYAVRGYNSNNSFGTSVTTGDTHINATFGGSLPDNSANHPLNLVIYMASHSSSTARCTFWGNLGYVGPGGYATGGYFSGSVRTASNVVNAVRFRMGVDTFDSGKIKMYGIK